MGLRQAVHHHGNSKPNLPSQVVQFREYRQSPANGVEVGSASPWQQYTKLTHSQVIQFRQYRQSPANGVEAGSDLTHGHHGLTAHDSPLRVYLQDVNQVHVDVAHLLLVQATAEAHVGPAGPGCAHGSLTAICSPLLHLCSR